jgi:hypothetical protein
MIKCLPTQLTPIMKPMASKQRPELEHSGCVFWKMARFDHHQSFCEVTISESSPTLYSSLEDSREIKPWQLSFSVEGLDAQGGAWLALTPESRERYDG